ncbi:MAG TPA: flagellar motor switch protein FliG [Verrucomicrobiae bacterium]|nr:flagellar motor switch protein FliG [Verrucomicrobiae bacterium]
MAEETTAMSGLRKAAILLVVLGDEAASAVYKNLAENELRDITQEITELDFISPEVASKILQEYHRLTLTQEYLAQGGPAYASQLLMKAFGEAGANSLLDQVMKAQEGAAHNLVTLQKADPQQLAKFIQGEHPQTIALVLAHMSGKAAAAVLSLLPEKLRGQAIVRMAQMQQFSPEMVQKISLILSRKMMSLGEQSRRGFGGVKAVADLLNTVETTLSSEILTAVEEESPQLAVSIRNFMFTFQDFLEVPESSIRELLGQLEKKSLALSLKGASDDLKNHFFKCMSSRAVEMLKEDMETLGPTRSREVNAAQQEAIALARKLEAAGKMILKNESEEAFVV